MNIKASIHLVNKYFSLWGVNLKTLFLSIKSIPRFIKDYKNIKSQIHTNNSPFPIKPNYPVLNEFDENAGVAKGHYFHQDLLIAQKIFEANPKIHFDVGSRIDGFVAHVASFRKIKTLDIRPLKSASKNIEFEQGDLMCLNDELTEVCDSLSCLHALEHFGLGRYNDKIDADGHIKGFDSLTKMLKPEGTLYISIPIGPQRIEFNAHRVFSVEYLINIFQKKFTVETFSYVDDHGNLHLNQLLEESAIRNNYGCNYGCGIFELKKLH